MQQNGMAICYKRRDSSHRYEPPSVFPPYLKVAANSYDGATDESIISKTLKDRPMKFTCEVTVRGKQFPSLYEFHAPTEDRARKLIADYCASLGIEATSFDLEERKPDIPHRHKW
jgi:hypothetical protein